MYLFAYLPTQQSLASLHVGWTADWAFNTSIIWSSSTLFGGLDPSLLWVSFIINFILFFIFCELVQKVKPSENFHFFRCIKVASSFIFRFARSWWRSRWRRTGWRRSGSFARWRSSARRFRSRFSRRGRRKRRRCSIRSVRVALNAESVSLFLARS